MCLSCKAMKSAGNSAAGAFLILVFAWLTKETLLIEENGKTISRATFLDEKISSCYRLMILSNYGVLRIVLLRLEVVPLF